MSLSIALSYSPLMRSEQAQQSPHCSCPQINIYCSTGGVTEDERHENLHFQWQFSFLSPVLPGAVDEGWTAQFCRKSSTNWTFYLLLSSPEHFICYSPLPWSLCSSPIPSMDLQTPPLQPPSRGSVFIIVFIIAPHSYTAGSLHLKEIKNQKNAVRGWTMIPELQKWRNFWEGEGTHLVFLGIWWFKHIIVNCLEIVAAKSSECLQSLPAPFVWVLIEN